MGGAKRQRDGPTASRRFIGQGNSKLARGPIADIADTIDRLVGRSGRYEDSFLGLHGGWMIVDSGRFRDVLTCTKGLVDAFR